jgi:hypothetical protein
MDPDVGMDQSDAGVQNPIRGPDPQLTIKPTYTVFRTPSMAVMRFDDLVGGLALVCGVAGAAELSARHGFL